MGGVGHLATFPPVTVTFRNMYCTPWFLGDSELLRERLASGARVSDSRYQSPWDRWRCPGKLSLGSGLCYLFFTITASISCLYLFEMIHNKQKQRGLFSSFAPASSPRPSRLSKARPPRIPPTTSQEAVLATNFSKGACFP